MKFSTSKKELQEALQKLSKATPIRTTLPILNCVLINATNKKTTIRATDLEITIKHELFKLFIFLYFKFKLESKLSKKNTFFLFFFLKNNKFLLLLILNRPFQ